MKVNSDYIRQLRQQRGWSQEQLADIAGVNARTIQRLERGTHASVDTLKALAVAFAVDYQQLLMTQQQQVEPWYQRSSMVTAFVAGLRQFDQFHGRWARAEFWWFMLPILVVLAIATVIHPIALTITQLLVLLPMLAAGSRRLRDAGKSPWWQLMHLVPAAGSVMVIILWCFPSAQETDEVAV
jgi:uncharacterized membrane protein YhaH (DUF805 family)/DNA-binding XRE family transcriptional regulator